MAKRASLAEARDHLTELVRDVERGKSIELTRRGKPVAVLISRAEYDRLRSKGGRLIETLRVWREQSPSGFDGLTEDEVVSLRSRSLGRDVRFG